VSDLLYVALTIIVFAVLLLILTRIHEYSGGRCPQPGG